jgi:hypothetical protein
MEPNESLTGPDILIHDCNFSHLAIFRHCNTLLQQVGQSTSK